MHVPIYVKMSIIFKTLININKYLFMNINEMQQKARSNSNTNSVPYRELLGKLTVSNQPYILFQGVNVLFG